MNLFIVNSPFQIFQSFTIIKSSKNHNVLIILINQFENKDTYKETINFFGSNCKIQFIKLPISKNNFVVKKHHFLLFIIESFIKSFHLLTKKIDYLYLGEYRNPVISSFANFFKVNKRICLDDGFSSKNLINKSSLKLPFSTDFNKKIYLYNTIFNNTNPIVCDMSIVLNDGLDIVKNSVLVFGNNLSESNTVSVENELLYLSKVKKDNLDKVIIYKPHRFEDHYKLQKFKNKNLFDQIFTSALSFEFYLLKYKSIPKKVYGINSTTLYTCLLINKPIEIVSVLFEKSLYITNNKYENHLSTHMLIKDVSLKFKKNVKTLILK